MNVCLNSTIFTMWHEAASCQDFWDKKSFIDYKKFRLLKYATRWNVSLVPEKNTKTMRPYLVQSFKYRNGQQAKPADFQKTYTDTSIFSSNFCLSSTLWPLYSWNVSRYGFFWGGEGRQGTDRLEKWPSLFSIWKNDDDVSIFISLWNYMFISCYFLLTFFSRNLHMQQNSI